MGEYTMKTKLLLILGISFALISMLKIEMTLIFSVLYFAGIRASDAPLDLSGLPYFLGALALIALVFFLSRNPSPTGNTYPNPRHQAGNRNGRTERIREGN